MGYLSEHTLSIVGVISTIILISSFTYGFLLEEDSISFAVDEESIIGDVEHITSFGPRVTGSAEELIVSQYISDRFSEIGLVDVRIEEYQVTGHWFIDAEPEDHQILMHAQLEQGAQNLSLIHI